MKRLWLNFNFNKDIFALGFGIQRSFTYNEVYTADGLQIDHFAEDRHITTISLVFMFWSISLDIRGRKVKK
jgi:hypothetical protein